MQLMSVLGNIHSIESCGTVDGPGIRFVVFMQGCPMRCAYCHNPDSWNFNENKKVTIDEIFDEYTNLQEFCTGGLTVTGGEPLAQIDFVTELFKKFKENNIHTALDTSGILFDKDNTKKIDELLKYTELVMLDIKHINEIEHKKLTNFSNKNVLDFAKYLSSKNIPMWIRHVVVPSITDNEKYLIELGEFLSTLKNVKALDILPYHNMAISKYERLGIDYKLKNTPPLSHNDAIKARDLIIKTMKNALNKK